MSLVDEHKICPMVVRVPPNSFSFILLFDIHPNYFLSTNPALTLAVSFIVAYIHMETLGRD